jgi:IS1 family transposase/transposase-like protein
MNCYYCKNRCIKKGKHINGIQKYYCKSCKKYQQQQYQRRGWNPLLNKMIQKLVVESNGTRSIGRILEISGTTVTKRILRIAGKIQKPAVPKGKVFEADELKTYCGKKTRERWIIYAIRTDTKEVVDFRIGRRTKKNIGCVMQTLLLSGAIKIYTDGLDSYRYLIPGKIHSRRGHKTNHIERKNLSLRTHLKRLSRKTICFSRSAALLEACTKIYFWGKYAA